MRISPDLTPGRATTACSAGPGQRGAPGHRGAVAGSGAGDGADAVPVSGWDATARRCARTDQTTAAAHTTATRPSTTPWTALLASTQSERRSVRTFVRTMTPPTEIGRASCRGRV